MNINDPRYKNQGLHVVLALFTVDNGKFKVLLIKRKNEPYKNKWILVGGCAYNTETATEALTREIYEKTHIKNINFEMFNVYTNPNRSPLMRMIAIAHIGVADHSIIEKFKQSEKASDADWFEIDRIPELGYDHKLILQDAIKTLKEKIFSTTIIKQLMPEFFTFSELKKTYESILGITLDKRNFRKKMLGEQILEETNNFVQTGKTKPSRLYKFTNIKKQFNLYK